MGGRTARLSRFMPWLDASGRFSVLKGATTVVVVLPALWMGREFSSGNWDFPSPFVNLIYHSGLWATYLLLASLSVTPLRRITGWGRLAQLRRLLGLASFFYALLHVVAWFGLRFWDWSSIGTELLARLSLWVATLSTLVLFALAVTSFDAAMRAMGSRWKRLHRLVYAAAVLAVLHFLLSPGSVQGQPFLMAGALVWLLGWRLLDRPRLGTRPLPLMWLGLGAAAVSALLQPIWLATVQAERSPQPPLAALADNFNPDIWIYLGVPPMWMLLVWTIATVSIAAYRQRVPLPDTISRLRE